MPRIIIEFCNYNTEETLQKDIWKYFASILKNNVSHDNELISQRNFKQVNDRHTSSQEWMNGYKI